MLPVISRCTSSRPPCAESPALSQPRAARCAAAARIAMGKVGGLDGPLFVHGAAAATATHSFSTTAVDAAASSCSPGTSGSARTYAKSARRHM